MKELGFLSNGDVISKTASDFLGSHVGESQNKTSHILESAAGKVLIIDEAYVLDDDNYGKQVLDTLVEKIQGTPSDDMAVLLLGYEGPMLRMINCQNPGLLRRFPEKQAFFFDDYNDEELLAILSLYLKKQEVQAKIEFKEKALDMFRLQKNQKHFGNAGAVEMLVRGATMKAAMRTPETKNLVLLDSDIEGPGENRAEKQVDPLSRLDELYRMSEVKAQLTKMSRSWAVAKREGGDAPKLGHFVFRGSPGKFFKSSVLRIFPNQSGSNVLAGGWGGYSNVPSVLDVD